MHPNRRELLRGTWGLAVQGVAQTMLVENKKGSFRFLRGIAPYSSGAAAMESFEVVHATLLPAPPYRKGLEVIDRHLQEQRRPAQALCGIELRSPRPFTFQGFGEFNQGYVEELKRRDILFEGLNPVARTNVAPDLEPPSEVLLYGFSYTAPAPRSPRTFVVAGAGELTGDRLDARDIVRRGDVSEAGMREKVLQVLAYMDERLRGLGAEWGQVTTIEVYTVQNIFPLVKTLLLPRLGAAKIHGLRWHFARPPIQELEFEMDVRGCRRELALSG